MVQLTGRTPLALVIDDDPFIRMLARDSLERGGLEVIEADGAATGLLAIAARAPDIVLLDVVMPGLSGFEACRQARLLPGMEFCPIVMLTSLEDMDSVQQAYEAGATDFVSKPINWTLLEHRVRFILKAAASFRAVSSSDLQLARAQHLAAVGSWEWNVKSDAVSWSDEMCRICGARPGAVNPGYRGFLALVHPADRPRVGAAARLALAQGGSYDLEHRLLLPGGGERAVHSKADVVLGADATALTISGTLQDITERKQAEERIHALANFDGLTGLPNRNLLCDRLSQTLAAARRDASPVTLLCLDLDGFKFVNDSYGHAVGDALLQAVAERLRTAMRESDTVARLGGDEFVLVLPGPDEHLGAAQRVVDLFAAPFLAAARELNVTASVGVCRCPDDGDQADILLKHVDVAMYAAKEAGRNCFRSYARAMGDRIEQYVRMEGALRVALERGQFELHYQPKVDLRSGRLSGVEALLRWRHPAEGIMAPDRFIALAEATGLIVPIGEWVLRTACAQLRRWQQLGFDELSVAVNLSARQFERHDVAALVARALADTGLAARHLELELTESMLMSDGEGMLATLRQIKASGVTLALDDFGTGYSSLAYLKRFPIDVIKIDRSFVRNVTTDLGDASLTRAIVSMARALKMKTVAEGVETAGQLGFMRAIQCDSVQGYYFSRPVDADALTALLHGSIARPMLPRAREGRRTVLLLDDEPNMLNALTRVFRNEDCQVLSTVSAHEAFELLAVHRVQVIISDQRMADMSGTTFLSKVRELYPDTIRIILSGYTELDSVIDAINRGAVYRFFTKPWDDQFLRDQLREAFEHHWMIHGGADERQLRGVEQLA